MRRLATSSLSLALLAGCALQPAPPRALDPALPRQVELRQVPFFAQDAFQCGPAALAMVLDFYGQQLTPADLRPQVFLPARSGSLQIEMQAAARRQGYLAYPLAPRLHDLLAELAAGHPVIVLLNLGFAWYPVWHYAVVIGYDHDQDRLLLRHGRSPRDRLSSTTFEHTWARSGHWGLVVLPPDRLPRTARAATLVAADLALARSGPAAAAGQAWQATLGRWPDNLTAAIGLGNAQYRQARLADAAATFRRAAQQHPDSDVALNNLAQALQDMGQRPAARAAARRAVALHGRHQADAQQTLASIAAASRAPDKKMPGDGLPLAVPGR